MKNRIGIVGGGQLGRMLIAAAHKLDFKVTVLDPTENSPAGQIADKQIVGSFKDKAKILELGNESDFITFETESANWEALEELMAKGMPVNPDPKTLRIIKDKFNQKAFLQEHSIPVGEFALVDNEEDCKRQGELFGYPFLLKARFDAYDGKGNFVVKSEQDIAEAFQKLGKNSSLYAEKFVSFTNELAVVSARDMFGQIVSYPVAETIHKNNICHIVRSPALVSEEIKKNAENIAQKVLSALSGVGVFAVEMFLTSSGEILVNEIAPRVHNSGHHTIEAFNASQFEQHIRAITGMHVVDIEKTRDAAVMVNILGERTGESDFKIEDNEENINEDAKIHIYGKIDTKPERKMGHITVLGNTIEEAEQKAKKISKNISI